MMTHWFESILYVIMKQQRLINSIILIFLLLLYAVLHANMEGYVYNKVKGMNDIVYYALIDNVWYIWLLMGLEVAVMSYYLWHYRHDVAFRFWHVWVFIFLFVVLVLTDEEWVIISHDDSWYSVANISKGIVLVGFLGAIATYFFNRKKREKEEYDSKIDNRRKEYAKTIVDGLTKVENLTGSYAIGICGGWGSGKTTFLREIVCLLKERKCDVHWFNAWDCSSEQNISSDFFAMLRAAIRPYCSSLDQSIFDYEAALADVGVPTFLQKVANWIVGNKGQSIYDLKVQIRRALVKAGHDVYIIIDDLDRMEAGEILEVLKLIRNNADFPHLKFIVAYDKMYVRTQILDKTKKEGYLNKIFMAEYFLPKLSNYNSKYDLIYNSIIYIGDENKTRLSGLIKYRDRQIIEATLDSLRKAEIFARQFDMNYKFITSGEAHANYHIGDFFWLELLKMTDARIYDLLDTKPEKILTYKRNKSGAFYYKLRNEADLKEFHISSTTLAIINKLLFGSNNVPSLNRLMYVENYPNYFAMGLVPGKLHRAEFDKLINCDDDNDTVVKTIYSWINNGQYDSLMNHILMTPLGRLRIEPAKKMVMCAIAYCFRANGNSNYINKLVDGCFNLDSFMTEVKNELQAYATEIMNSYVGNKDVLLSVASIMVKVIANIKRNRLIMLWSEDYCVDILKRNFLSYLENEQPDASEIFDDDKMLSKIVKKSCWNYTISANEEYGDDEHYHVQYIADELISWFREHKSRNKRCFREFESQYEVNIAMDTYYQHDFDQEGYDYGVESIFGSFDVFKRFKEECFVK